MSLEDNLSENRRYIPNNYLEIQEAIQAQQFEKEITQPESSTVTITPSSFCCDHSSEINTLKKIVFGLTVCFLISIIYSQYSYGVLHVENERLIKEIKENKYIFNQHIDYTIGYIQVLKDNLDKTIELFGKLKYPNVSNRPHIIYS
jgi:hypothetical protein